jgi:hypothetical protein
MVRKVHWHCRSDDLLQMFLSICSEPRDDKLGRLFDRWLFVMLEHFLDGVKQIGSVPDGDRDNGGMVIRKVGGNSCVNVLWLSVSALAYTVS